MNEQKPVQVGCTDDPRVRQKIVSIRADAVDRMSRGWSEMNMLISRGLKLPGQLRGEHIDGGSLTHDLWVVKCDEVKAWADSLLSNAPAHLPAPAGKVPLVVGPDLKGETR